MITLTLTDEQADDLRFAVRMAKQVNRTDMERAKPKGKAYFRSEYRRLGALHALIVKAQTEERRSRRQKT